MQTFLPYPSFAQTARVLDYKRLGKQRIEAREILYITTRLEGQENLGWLPTSDSIILSDEELRFRGDKVFNRYKNHPACRMWLGYPRALMLYFDHISEEWMNRGYKHTLGIFFVPETPELPEWFGDRNFHLSHQSNLLRKNPEYYGKYFSNRDIPDDLPYVWPK